MPLSRRHTKVFTWACVISGVIGLLVIIQDLDNLEDQRSPKEKSARHSKSNAMRNDPYAADGSEDLSIVKIRHGVAIQETNDANAYSSVLSAPKVIARKRDDYSTRRKTQTNHGKGQNGSVSKPKFIVILAQMRTGSSVVGEILNQNKNFFYVYEPLHIVHDWEKGEMTKSEENQLITSLLRNISRCDFSAEFVKSHGSWGGRTRSRAIMPLCKKRDICANLLTAVYRQICMAFNGNVATKLIRANLQHLRPIMEEKSLDVRVIHLVRDPRGTANSRLEYLQAKSIPDALEGTLHENLTMAGYVPVKPRGTLPDEILRTSHSFCTWITTNLRVALSKPDWLRGRYKLVRYEDFAEWPMATAQEIYRFLGLATPLDVLDWIRDNTKSKIEKNEGSINPLFSISKNSTVTASKWRLGLKREEVIQVQGECSEAMRLLGYRTVGARTPLTDLSVPLIRPLNLQLP